MSGNGTWGSCKHGPIEYHDEGMPYCPDCDQEAAGSLVRAPTKGDPMTKDGTCPWCDGRGTVYSDEGHYTEAPCGLCGGGIAEVQRLRELLRRVVMDYGEKCCDDLGSCACSMAQAVREVHHPGRCSVCSEPNHSASWKHDESERPGEGAE